MALAVYENQLKVGALSAENMITNEPTQHGMKIKIR